MTRLHRDISRCVGRSDLTPESVACPDRERCARYRAIETDRQAIGPDASYPFSMVMTLRDADGACRHRIEVGA